jgi:hypothetical protein
VALALGVDAVQAGCCMAPDRYRLRDMLNGVWATWSNNVVLQTAAVATWQQHSSIAALWHAYSACLFDGTYSDESLGWAR